MWQVLNLISSLPPFPSAILIKFRCCIINAVSSILPITIVFRSGPIIWILHLLHLNYTSENGPCCKNGVHGANFSLHMPRLRMWVGEILDFQWQLSRGIQCQISQNLKVLSPTCFTTSCFMRCGTDNATLRHGIYAIIYSPLNNNDNMRLGKFAILCASQVRLTRVLFNALRSQGVSSAPACVSTSVWGAFLVETLKTTHCLIILLGWVG